MSIILPFDPITFPYLVTENLVLLAERLFDERKILSEVSLLAPYILIGLTALSVEIAISCTSGTAALHLVYRSLEITKGDIVVSPTLTFSGTVSPAQILGADIIFADCDKNTGLININSVLEIIQKLIKINRIKNLKVISVVNLNGQTPNLKLLSQLSKKYKFYIIEDACHSLGSFYENKKKFPVGSCKYSDFSTFSFHPVKAITTGEGGMITTNNKRYYNYIKKLRNHNFDYPKKAIKNKPWFYAINDIFLNYRMSDINAALGLSQLKKLDKFVEKRNLLASYYSELLRKYKCKNIEIVKNLDYSTHSYHLLLFQVIYKRGVMQLFHSYKILQILI